MDFKEFILHGRLFLLEENDAQMDMYRKLTMTLHPDRDAGDEEAMKTVNAAKDNGDWRTITDIYRQYIGEPPEGAEEAPQQAQPRSRAQPRPRPEETGDNEWGERNERWKPPSEAFGVEGEPWRQKAAKYMEGEVKTLDAYMSGDVWGYTIENEEGDVVNSVWGFVGDEEYCRKEAESFVAWQKKEDRKKKEKHEYTINVEPDENIGDPFDEQDFVGEIAHWHRRGFWGKSIRGNAQEWVQERERNGDVVLPLYLYEHSGQRISLHPFGDRWDSGQVGYIWCSKEKAMEEWGEKPQTMQIKKKK